MLEKLNDTEFDIIYEIMEASFPKEERRTYNEQKLLLDNDTYTVYVYKNPQTRVIQAFAAVWEFAEMVFVEHLAVGPQDRNHGIGAKILKEITHMTEKIVCLEVEPPSDEMGKRRIAFYERNHFFFHDYPYIQPSISNGRKAIPLNIMTYGSKITEKQFEAIRKILYKNVYCVEC